MSSEVGDPSHTLRTLPKDSFMAASLRVVLRRGDLPSTAAGALELREGDRVFESGVGGGWFLQALARRLRGGG